MNLKSLQLLGLGIASLIFVSSCSTPPPSPVLPLPTQEQINWQKMETYAFIHFGLNTFNDMEWGFGDTPASTFNPTELDCSQWVAILKAAGMKGVILTTKHHDGFCLWPTKTTEYSVKNSPWRNGKGDMVKELSDACKDAGLKFGIYLSPWDRNSAYYAQDEYVKIYHTQINELISNYGPLFEYWFDGANGGNGWYGGANETRSINKGYYEFEKAREMIKAKHPSVIIFGGTAPDVRWVGNEACEGGETNWAAMTLGTAALQNGMRDGEKWLPVECDVSIRPSWFYHPWEDNQVKSVGNLINYYYQSVGRNSTFLLNFPVAINGKIHPVDSARIINWHQAMQDELKNNVLKGAEVTASSTRGSSYSAEKVIDDSWDTYWATPDGENTGSLMIDLKKPTLINRLLIQEYITLGQRVASFNVEAEIGGKWAAITTKDEMTTIGYKRILRFSTANASRIRINFTDAKGPLCINNIEAYLAPLLMEEPKITRNEKDEVRILAAGGSEIYYTTDGSSATKETGKLYTFPFAFVQKGTVKAIAYDREQDKQSPEGKTKFDLPASSIKLVDVDDKARAPLFDGTSYWTFRLPVNENELVMELKKPETIRGFVYSPHTSADKDGFIDRYEFYVDGKKVSSGEFSNIKHNRIPRVVTFNPIKGRKIILKATRLVDDTKQVFIGEFSLLTAE